MVCAPGMPLAAAACSPRRAPRRDAKQSCIALQKKIINQIINKLCAPWLLFFFPPSLQFASAGWAENLSVTPCLAARVPSDPRVLPRVASCPAARVPALCPHVFTEVTVRVPGSCHCPSDFFLNKMDWKNKKHGSVVGEGHG